MKRHLLAGKYGPKDRTPIPKRGDEILTRLNLIGDNKKLNYGIGHTLDDLMKLGIFPSEVGVDLFVFAAHVWAADTHISRSTESQDSWTREIRVVVPVSHPEKWNAASSTLKRALDFLTGDLWTINFRPRPTHLSKVAPTDSSQPRKIPFDSIALFSGGLDSLIGAIDLLERGGNPFLISHAGEAATSNAQQKCFDALKIHYTESQLDRLRVWMSFPGVPVRGNELEKSTRSRSFLFFTLGILAGTGFNAPFVLRAPENGLIALNIPLDPLRLGSHSTRTMHPFYTARWNEVLEILGISGKIENPFWNKTKGEIVEACADKTLLQRLVPISLSCSSPTKERWRGKSVQHCGYCLPCLIRRAALRKGLGANADTTIYTVGNLRGRVLDTSKAEGQQVRSCQFAIKRLNTNPNLARIIVHGSGSLSDEPPAKQLELVDVYRRGMTEVAAILTGVITKPK